MPLAWQTRYRSWPPWPSAPKEPACQRAAVRPIVGPLLAYAIGRWPVSGAHGGRHSQIIGLAAGLVARGVRAGTKRDATITGWWRCTAGYRGCTSGPGQAVFGGRLRTPKQLLCSRRRRPLSGVATLLQTFRIGQKPPYCAKIFTLLCRPPAGENYGKQLNMQGGWACGLGAEWACRCENGRNVNTRCGLLCMVKAIIVLQRLAARPSGVLELTIRQLVHLMYEMFGLKISLRTGWRWFLQVACRRNAKCPLVRIALPTEVEEVVPERVVPVLVPCHCPSCCWPWWR